MLHPSTLSCLTLPLRNSLPSSFSSTRCAYSTASTREKSVSIDTYFRPVNVCSFFGGNRYTRGGKPEETNQQTMTSFGPVKALSRERGIGRVRKHFPARRTFAALRRRLVREGESRNK